MNSQNSNNLKDLWKHRFWSTNFRPKKVRMSIWSRLIKYPRRKRRRCKPKESKKKIRTCLILTNKIKCFNKMLKCKILVRRRRRLRNTVIRIHQQTLNLRITRKTYQKKTFGTVNLEDTVGILSWMLTPKPSWNLLKNLNKLVFG